MINLLSARGGRNAGSVEQSFRLRGQRAQRGAQHFAALTEGGLGKSMGVLAVALASVNIFGGFLVTRRMLEMFKKKERPAAGGAKQ